jgi:hypothetical protein
LPGKVVCPASRGDAVDIRSAQKLAWENKLAKGFNTTDVPLEFCAVGTVPYVAVRIGARLET